MIRCPKIGGRNHTQFVTKGFERVNNEVETLVPNEGPDMGSISLTRTDAQPEATHSLASPLDRGTLIVNLRAETDPEVLKAEVNKAVASLENIKGEVSVLASFRPGRPTPTHRMAEAVG